jgi:ketosteroid isomerase-like protein
MGARDRAETVTEFLNSIGKLDFNAVDRLLADDAIAEFPFIDGLPPVLGKKAIVDQLSGTIPQMFERMYFTVDKCYAATDDDALIAEYRSECPRVGGGTYTNRYIAVFRFEGDQISLYREYMDPSKIGT